jgi:hypothetical protein
VASREPVSLCGVDHPSAAAGVAAKSVESPAMTPACARPRRNPRRAPIRLLIDIVTVPSDVGPSVR